MVKRDATNGIDAQALALFTMPWYTVQAPLHLSRLAIFGPLSSSQCTTPIHPSMLRIEFLPGEWGKEKWVMLSDSRIFFRQSQWRSVAAEFVRSSGHASLTTLISSLQKEATAL